MRVQLVYLEDQIEEAQGNITDLTANKTGFGNESTVGLSGGINRRRLTNKSKLKNYLIFKFI